MRSAEWNRNARRQVGRGAGDDRLKRPGDDFEVPRAVTEVFRDFNPKEEVQTGYHEADMHHKFPDIIPGAKGLNAGPMPSDSERTLSNWDPNEAMDLPENDDQI